MLRIEISVNPYGLVGESHRDGKQVSHAELVSRVTRAVRDALVVTKREKALADAVFDDQLLFGAGASDYMIEFLYIDENGDTREEAKIRRIDEGGE